MQALHVRLDGDSVYADSGSESESFSTQAPSEIKIRRKRPDRTTGIDTPTILDAICILHIGLQLLRLPVSTKTIYTWISKGSIPYQRSSNALGNDMRQYVAAHYLQVLNPHSELTIEELYQATLQVCAMYRKVFGLQIPTMNVGPRLLGMLNELSLPLECYAATLMTARLLDMQFTYDTQVTPRSQLDILRLPEGQLISLLLVVTRLLFPFNDEPWVASNASELAAAGVDWNAWAAARARMGEEKESIGLSHIEALRLTENDVPDMSEKTMDEYLDWYASMYTRGPTKNARTRRQTNFREVLSGMFPESRGATGVDQDATRSQETGRKAILKDANEAVQKTLAPREIMAVAPNGALRPGARYMAYNKVSDLSGHARLLYDEAADMTGLPVKMLFRGTKEIERRLATLV